MKISRSSTCCRNNEGRLRTLELQRCSFNSIWRARCSDDGPISSPFDFCCQNCITHSIANLVITKFRQEFGAAVKYSPKPGPKETKGQSLLSAARDFKIKELTYYFSLCIGCAIIMIMASTIARSGNLPRRSHLCLCHRKSYPKITSPQWLKAMKHFLERFNTQLAN